MNTTYTEIAHLIQQIEELAIPCDWDDECDREATWAVTVTKTKCGCSHIRFMCSPHLSEAVTQQSEFGNWFCEQCGAQYPLTRASELRTLGPIEAL